MCLRQKGIDPWGSIPPADPSERRTLENTIALLQISVNIIESDLQ